MKRKIRDLIDTVDAARHELMIRKAISEFGQSMGYDRYAYLEAAGLEFVPVTNYSAAWQKA